MSSGMENAQNFAAIISSMVLEPSFFDRFFGVWIFPGCFPQIGALGEVGATAGGGGASQGPLAPPGFGPPLFLCLPLLLGPFPQKNKGIARETNPSGGGLFFDKCLL